MKTNETLPFSKNANSKTEFYALGIAKLDPNIKYNLVTNQAIAVIILLIKDKSSNIFDRNYFSNHTFLKEPHFSPTYKHYFTKQEPIIENNNYLSPTTLLNKKEKY